MRARVGRFVRGTIDEDVQSGDQPELDVVFDPERIAAALAESQELPSKINPEES